jgi:uncharacterized protein (DUF983 family)
MPFLRAVWSLIRQRCPRCHVGRVFRGSIAMNDPCPQCGLVFQREEGYFLGAMYVSYGLSVLVIGVFYWTLLTIWPRLGALPVLAAIVILYAPLVPIVFRYSRVIWMYFDRAISPTDVSAGVYEKVRHLEVQQQAGEH